MLSHNFVRHIVLGSRHPENAAPVQIVKMAEVDIGLVEYDNLPDSDLRAQFGGLGGIVRISLLGDGESRQKRLQIQPHMAFHGGFPAPMFGPIHAIGDKANGCLVNHIHDALEPAGKPDVVAPHAEIRRLFLKAVQSLSKQFLGHVGVTDAVGLRQSISARRLRLSHSRKATRMVPERVANIVEAERMRKLCKRFALSKKRVIIILVVVVIELGRLGRSEKKLT